MDDRKLAVITPLMIVALFIALTQIQIVPLWLANHRSSLESSGPDVAGLQLVGYNYNKDLAQVSVSLWNKGDSPLVITTVYYDDAKLVKGVIGSPADNTTPNMATAHSHGNSSISSNDIIFPSSNHWNMFTGGGIVPVIEPNAIVMLYLGVTAETQSSNHSLTIVAGTEQYVFELK